MKRARRWQHWRPCVLIATLSLLAFGLVRTLPELPVDRCLEPSSRNLGESTREISAPAAGEAQIHLEANTIRASFGPTASARVLKRAVRLTWAGERASQLGERRVAINKFREAAELFERSGVPAEAAKVFRRLGFLYQGLGYFDQSLLAYEKALAWFRDKHDIAGTADTLNELGVTLYKLGQYDKALQALREGLELHRSLGSTSAEAASLENLGSISTHLGDLQRAEDYLREALRLWRQNRDPAGESRALGGMGIVYLGLGRKMEARLAFDQAYGLQREFDDHISATRILLELGDLALAESKYQDGLTFFEKILAVPTVEETARTRALVGAGSASWRLGDPVRALSLYQQALQRQRRSGDRLGEAQTIFAMARVERQQGRLEKALSLSTDACALIESLRSTVPGSTLRASFLATNHEFYEIRVEILMDLAQLYPDHGYESAALGVSERARARSLLDLLADAQVDAGRGIAPFPHEQERVSMSKLAGLERRNLRLRGALESYEAAEMEFSTQRGGSEELRSPPPTTWPELAKVLDPDVALLEYSLGAKRSFLWVATRDSLTSYELPPRQTIEDLAHQAFEYLSHSDGWMEAAAADQALGRLSRVLLAPAASRLSYKRLAIVPDGALEYIPFAALRSPDHPELPLIAEHEIVSLPSASVLVALRENAAHRPVAPKTVAVFADPVFNSMDPRVAPAVRAARPEITTDTRATPVFARLSYSREEAEAILRLVPAREASAFLGLDANRESVTAEALDEYRIVHFATHSVIDTTRPELSGIVLSLVDHAGHKQLGFLGLHEISNLRLNADLVVLSACQTALGREVRGEGLIGLTRSFYGAGARSVLASLWSVNDRSTAELMARFYRAMLENSLSPSAALRAAQVSMLREPRFRSPYYWAGFILQGDWRQKQPFLETSESATTGVAGP